ncbi:MAG: hypothetical protein RLZZ28_1503 [Bacteroidota bacterium]
MANQKKQSAQYLPLDCFTSMCLIFGKDKEAGSFLAYSLPRLLNFCGRRPRILYLTGFAPVKKKHFYRN